MRVPGALQPHLLPDGLLGGGEQGEEAGQGAAVDDHLSEGVG